MTFKNWWRDVGNGIFPLQDNYQDVKKVAETVFNHLEKQHDLELEQVYNDGYEAGFDAGFSAGEG